MTVGAYPDRVTGSDFCFSISWGAALGRGIALQAVTAGFDFLALHAVIAQR